MKYATLSTTALLAAVAAYGQFTNQQIVVTATRIETPIEQVGSSITVIDQEQIKAQGAQNLQSALRLVPGVQLAANGGPGAASSVFIRGSESDHTLVLINGIRVNSNTDGGFNFSAIPVGMIENIEVLRGPQSGLYGSDALGGVINVTTKKGSEVPLGGFVETTIGEKGYRNGSIGLHGGNKIIDFNTSVSFLGLENHDIAKNNGGTEDDPYERTSAYAGLGLNFAADGRADLTVLYTEDDNELDAFGGVDDPLENSQKKKLITGLSASMPLSAQYTQSASAGYNWQKYTGVNSGSASEYLTSSYDASLKGDWTPIENNTLSVGYDYRRSEAENIGNFAKEHRDQNAVFVNNQWNWKESLFINLGGRYDDYSDIDGETTWKASASWFALESTRLHGSIGTGYRAPTMNDLYYTYGGPARTYLKPEQSESFDIGIEQSVLDGKLVADVTFFRSDVEDLIAWSQITPGNWQPDNVAQAKIKGVETSLTVSPVDALALRTFYTFTDAVDADSDNELPRRARHTAGASVKWQCCEKVSIYSDVTYTGKRFDDTYNTTELEGYYLVGAGASYALNPTSKLVAHISNLLDEDYETAAGYGTVGRVASAGVEVSF